MSREDRRQRLLESADRLGVEAILLGLPANFAWYTGGADNRVDQSQPVGAAVVLVTPEAEYIVTDNIEAPRMREEETPGFEVAEHAWYEDPASLYRELAGGVPLGADVPLEGIRDVSEGVAPLRYVLDADAIELYRQAGSETTAAMLEAAGSVSRGMTEHEAAANLVAACRRRRLITPVVLVAADERIAGYRHPIPRGAPVERRVMLVVCAELGGLYVSLTRIVHLEEPGEDFKGFYVEAGFPDEWRLHHQGGMAGYAAREIIASPETRQEVRAGQAFAWNPSITGAKAEETFVLTENGPAVISGP
jgi:Xaa-Pro dipeptidase